MVWIELLVAAGAGGVGLGFSLAISAVAGHLESHHGVRRRNKRLPYLEAAPIAADDTHLAEVVAAPREEELLT